MSDINGNLWPIVAVLASVVRYEKTDKTYTLSATVLGVRVTMESDGPKRTDFGVQQ